MINKLILVEGIPGSGKSIISRKIHAYLKAKILMLYCLMKVIFTLIITFTVGLVS